MGSYSAAAFQQPSAGSPAKRERIERVAVSSRQWLPWLGTSPIQRAAITRSMGHPSWARTRAITRSARSPICAGQ